MNTAPRLGLYGAGLAVVFGGAFAAADAVVPQSAVNQWTQEAKGYQMNAQTNSGMNSGMASDSATSGHADHTAGTDEPVRGVSSAQDGYLLTPVTAPSRVDRSGTLSFRILDAHGMPVTRYTSEHDKQLHLIVVCTDGTQFRHVHPTLAPDGTWSLPWSWTTAGTYRVYADFVPAAADGQSITLTRTVQVAGSFRPVNPGPTMMASVDGFTVQLAGDLTSGATADLRFSVTKDGKPVSTLQPYLGAFGHLVALREGDLAYLHVHPEGDEATAGQRSGPAISFMAEVPTPGRYLLYLDFQVDGKVHTAPFVVDATRGTHAMTAHQRSTSDMGSGVPPAHDSNHDSSHESGHSH